MEDTQQRRAHATRRGMLATGAVAVLGVATFAATPAHAQVRTPARVTSSHFLQTVTSGNVVGDSTVINSPATNGKPNAVLFVSQNTTAGFLDNHPIGVSYASGVWSIFNEDLTTMPIGAQFFVLAFSGSSATDFVLTASTSNISGDTAFISSAKTNHKPTAQLQVTQNWDPGEVGYIANPHNPGVWYDGSQWGVFNEDVSTMTTGVSFNVLVGSTGTSGGSLAVQKVTSSNLSGNGTYVTNSHSNNDPSAVIFATSNYNPGHHGGTYDNSPLSVGYSTIFGKWAVQNRVGSMSVHMAFNLLIFTS